MAFAANFNSENAANKNVQGNEIRHFNDPF